MRRFILVLAVSALMAAMMVAMAAPALAKPGGNGWGYGWATGPTYGWGTDADGDGLKKSEDNCPNDKNPGQEDNDDDGIGNLCDPTPKG
jgi:hypothetical protein